MRETAKDDIYYTQGEYVTYFDRKFTPMGIEEALMVREAALKLAKKQKVKVNERSGTGIKKSRKTITLPKHIWAEAYKNWKT